jgi:hypothetical protein
MERIERAWLVDDAMAATPEVLGEYAGTHLIAAAGNPLIARLAPAGSARDYLYIVDPLGNVMMRYGRDADPSRIKKDVTRLLKVSHVG